MKLPQLGKRIAIGVAIGMAIAVAIAGIALIALDRALPGIVAKAVGDASGRKLTIGGAFDIDRLTWPPRVRAEQVSLANAEWGSEPTMFEAKTVEFTIAPLPLLRGQVVVAELILGNPRLLLERNADGRRNWVLSRAPSAGDSGPQIGRLRVDRGSVSYRDPAANTELVAGIADQPADAGAATSFVVSGTLRGVPLSASGSGGKVLALRDTSVPFPLDAELRLAGVRATLAGTLTGLLRPSALDLAFSVSGRDLARLAPLLEVPLDLPPFEASGRLSLHQQQWRLSEFDGKLGASRLAGTLQVDRSGKVPSFDGKLTSQRFDAALLRRWLDARSPRAGAQRHAWTTLLRGTNGQLRFAFERVRNAPFAIDAVAGALRLRDGVATIDPLDIRLAGGTLAAELQLDATKTPPAARLSTRVEQLALARLFPASSLARGVGGLGGQATLAARGSSLAALTASAAGNVRFVVTGGEIDARLIESLQLDPGDILRLAFGSRSSVKLDCAVADFAVERGTLKAQTFVIDTPETTVVVTGSIDLAERRLDLLLTPVTTSFRLFSVPVPVHISGGFAKPAVSADSSAALRGGAALLLGGLLGPLAALLPLIDPGGERSRQCDDLLARARAPAK